MQGESDNQSSTGSKQNDKMRIFFIFYWGFLKTMLGTGWD
jgi:hypothetical protein